jgi:hypothetical protein
MRIWGQAGQTIRHVRVENHVPQLTGNEESVPNAKETLEKGRPPPGGEEAEVVVYQPRGVGLMHTRRKPSNAYYTHATAEGRKCCLPEKAPDSRKGCSHPHLS